VEPIVFRTSDFQAESVVVSVASADEDLPITWKLILMKSWLGGLGTRVAAHPRDDTRDLEEL
jgi:hypothetical protein